MRGKVHISVNCPITTFLKENRHSALSEHLKQKDAQSKFSEGGGVVQRNWKSHSKFCSDDTIYLFCLRTFNLSLHLKFYPSKCDTLKELSLHSNQTWLWPKTPPNQSKNICWQNILKHVTFIDKYRQDTGQTHLLWHISGFWNISTWKCDQFKTPPQNKMCLPKRSLFFTDLMCQMSICFPISPVM